MPLLRFQDQSTPTPRTKLSEKKFNLFSFKALNQQTAPVLFQISFQIELQKIEFEFLMDKHGNVLDMGNSVPVSSTSDSALKLQRSISSKLDSVLIESPIKKNKIKGQNSIAGLCLKPQSSPISHVNSFRESSMILYLDTFFVSL